MTLISAPTPFALVSVRAACLPHIAKTLHLSITGLGAKKPSKRERDGCCCANHNEWPIHERARLRGSDAPANEPAKLGARAVAQSNDRAADRLRRVLDCAESRTLFLHLETDAPALDASRLATIEHARAMYKSLSACSSNFELVVSKG